MRIDGEYTLGLGKSRFFLEMDEYQKGLGEILGARPFPGTLNLKVGPEDLERLRRYRKETMPGFRKMGREFGKVECIRARIGDEWVLIVFPEKSSHSGLVEIVSGKELRKALGISPGARVSLQL